MWCGSTCASYANFFRVDYRGTELKKEHLCNLFIPKGVRHGQLVKPVPARSKERRTDKLATGIVLKRDRAELHDWLLAYDWAKVANISTNRNLNFTKPVAE
ncbi:MAG: hypothetical protein ISN26_02305 [Betaproteobacteria bacterium AqS2]|uniref:Uncharacterized protein n=1 Tax=Candidatus Amphirhobacter heronislandensis TaxID=1732024 RepID=A0A930UFN7_9GAMM|nr:hypothetical protein [Betaproteobacteria bacterium AqS2]